MVKKGTIVDIQYVGRLSLTGKTKKTKKGKIILVEPKAVTNLNFESPWKYKPVPAVNETIFAVPSDYREATTEKDVAYFKATLFDEDENIISEDKANSKEVFAKYNYFAQTLRVKENFEKYADKLPTKLKRKILVECFLKTKKWKRESDWEVLTKDSKVLEFEISLQKPERPNWPAPTVKVAIGGHYITEQDCGEECTCLKYATEYDIYAGILNNGKSDIISGKFRLKGWPLSKTGSWISADINKLPLKPGKYDILIKDIFRYKYGERGDWYVQTDIFGHLGLNSEKSGARLNYKLDYELTDASGYSYNGSQDVCIDIVIPQYKFDAMEIYNQLITLEWSANIGLGLAVGGYGLLLKSLAKILSLLGGVAVGSAGTMTYASLKSEAKNLMDDPPKLVKKYLAIRKIPGPAPIATVIKITLQNLRNLETNIFSAKHKRDFNAIKKFSRVKLQNQKTVAKALNQISRKILMDAQIFKKYKVSAQTIDEFKRLLKPKQFKKLIKKQLYSIRVPNNKVKLLLFGIKYWQTDIDIYNTLVVLARSVKNLSKSLKVS